MKTLEDVREGDVVFVRCGCDSRRKPYPSKVTKVTRTHIHLYHGKSKFLKTTGTETNTRYAADIIYASLEEIEVEERVNTKWIKFRRLVDRAMPKDMTEIELDSLIARFDTSSQH